MSNLEKVDAYPLDTYQQIEQALQEYRAKQP